MKPRIPLAVRFESRIKKTPTCWLWTGSKLPAGYGMIGAGGRGGGEMTDVAPRDDQDEQPHDWAFDTVFNVYRCRRCLVTGRAPHGPICQPKSATLPPAEEPDEELTLHRFKSRTPYEPGDDRDVWCKECEYHRDHEVHAVARSTRAPAEEPQP